MAPAPEASPQPDALRSDSAEAAPGGAQRSARGSGLDRGLAVCFCGGRSERMGRDKALLRGAWMSAGGSDNPRQEQREAAPSTTTLLAHTLSRLESLGCSEVVLSSGPGSARYGFAGKRELVDAETPSSGPQAPKAAGPLAGLVAALEDAKRLDRDWIFVLACDLPRVRVETMLALVDHAVGLRADVCLAQTTDDANLDNSDESSQIHPLFGFYSVRCLGPARRALEAGRRRMIAFHDVEFSKAPFDEEVGESAATGAGTAPLSIVTFNVAAAETTNLNTPNDYERELSSAPAAARAHENGTS